MLKNVLMVTTVAALTTFATSGRAQSQSSSATAGSTSGKTDRQSAKFIKEAAEDNDMEIAMAEIGSQKAQNPDLKNFCQQLQQDHTQANQQLQPIAQKYGITLEQSTKGKSHHEVSQLDKEQSGAKFDQKFAELMLKNHQKDIQKFEKASTQLQDPEVKQYAQTMLPKLEQHFQTAQTVAKAVGVDQSTISRYAQKLPPSVGGTGEEQNPSKGAGARGLKQDSSSGSSTTSQ